MAVTDLTGYTWVGNNNVNVTSASVGTYNINYSITCDNTHFNSSGGTLLKIVFTQEYFPPEDENESVAYIEINTDNYTSFGGVFYQFNGRIYESSYNATLPSNCYLTEFTSSTYVTSITFTGGTDVTNATLIAWLEANGTLTAPVVTAAVVTAGSISIGSSPLQKCYVGNNEAQKIYLGDKLLYEKQAPASGGYITFSSPSSFTLNVVDNKKYWNGTLEYSTDTATWNTWSGTSAISSASDGTKHNLYLRGTGNTYITGSSASAGLDGTVTKAKWVLTGNSISCDGNIEYLLDYNTVLQGNHPTMANNCYKTMFSDCTSLTIAPSLPATTLTTECYSYMFKGCTSLTTAPSLPATTLARMCYYSMFYKCTNLTIAPNLPATTLKGSCYQYMFQGCMNLTTVPSLPATTLTSYCYHSMFYQCAKIKLSTTQTGNYQTAYRIPTSGTGTDGSNSLTSMFASTGGTFTGTPIINTTYYTSNTVV